LLNDIRNLSKPETLYKQLERFFDKESSKVAGAIVAGFLSGGDRRSGNLARAVVGRGVRDETGLPSMRIGVFKGPAQDYAGVQEHGTKGKEPDSPIPTIKPRKAKALAFPVPKGGAVTRAGVARFDGPRDFPKPLRFVPFTSSGIAIGGLYDKASLEREQKRARRQDRHVSLRNVKLVYLLLTQVDLHGKHYLRDGLEAALPGTVLRLSLFLKDLLSRKKRII